MKALINNQIYNVNYGNELELHNDEGFDNGIMTIQIPQRIPLPNYTYVNIWERNDSYLSFVGTANTFAPVSFTETIESIYIDIDLNATTNDILDLGNTTLKVVSGKLVLENLTQQTETGVIITTGRQKIFINKEDGRFELYANGVKQAITTSSNYVDNITATDMVVGGASVDFKLYDLRLDTTALNTNNVLEIVTDNYNIDNFMGYQEAQFVYTDFKEDYTIGSTWGVINLGINVLGDLGQFQVGIFPVKEWNLFTQAPKSIWYDRDDEIYQHTLPLIELIEWFTTIKTPFIDLSNPISGTPKFSTVKDMIDHIYNVAFPELEDVNVGFAYNTELLNLVTAFSAFDIRIPEGNLHTALRYVFQELNGKPKIVKIENGQITLGIKHNTKVNNYINFDDFDYYEAYNPTQGYGTVGESRGLNVINSSGNDNKNSLLYTEETGISVRSEEFGITESNMIIQFFYPIERIIKVEFFELDNPTNTVDITKYVVLESQWRLLKSSGFSAGTTSLFKQNTIRYEKGGFSLYGLGDAYERWFILPNLYTWEEIIRSAQNNASIPVNIPSTWEDFSVRVQYETRSTETLFRIAKEDISFVQRYSTLQTNQGGNIVDSKRFASTLHSDIQTSGNKIIQYNRTALESINDLYELNDLDLLTDSMIKVVKITFGEGSYDTVNILSKDYQSITQNLDISAKVRLYNISDGTKSVRFYEDYIEWNLDGIENNESSVTSDGIESFMRTFGKPTALSKLNVDNVEITSTDIVDENGAQQSLIIPVEADGHRNTLKFMFGFEDPTFAYGKKKTETVSGSNVQVEQGIRYTDANGYLDVVALEYGKQYTATDSVTLNQLPVVDPLKYSGNPLIEFGAITEYFINVPGTDIYRTYLEGITSEIVFEEYVYPARKAVSYVTNFNWIYNTSGSASFTKTDIVVKVITSLDNEVTIGSFTFTPNTLLTVPINADIKRIIVVTDIQFTKDINEVFSTIASGSHQERATVSSSGLQLSLGITDIWQQNYFIHNVFYKTTKNDIGEIIIGDESMINNVLVGGATKSATTALFVYESDPYDKLERTFVKGTQKGNVNALVTFGTQSITCNAVIGNGKAWAIGDSNGKLLFAVNPIRNSLATPEKTVSFNFVHFRTGLIREY